MYVRKRDSRQICVLFMVAIDNKKYRDVICCYVMTLISLAINKSN